MRRFTHSLTHSLVVRFVVGLILAVFFLFPSSIASADTGVSTDQTYSLRHAQHILTACTHLRLQCDMAQNGFLVLRLSSGEKFLAK